MHQDEQEGFCDVTETVEENNNINEEGDVEGPALGVERPKRERRRTEFFGEPIPWDSIGKNKGDADRKRGSDVM